MSRVSFVLFDHRSREDAACLCETAPKGTYVEFRESKRTDEQNRKMWPMLTEVARQVEWPEGSGMKLTAEDWKLVFLDALGYEMRMVPGISKRGYVNLGRSSSKLTKAEFSDLIEIIYAFGSEHGVRFREPAEAAQ